MGDVRLAGGALLALVGGDREVEGLADRLEIGARVLLEDRPRRARAGAPRDRGPCRAGRRRRPAHGAGPRRDAAVAVGGLGAWCRGWPSVQGYPQPKPARCSAGLGLGTLVPGHRAVRADDRALVALAGEQDDVAGAGPLERRLDGGPAVGDQRAGRGRGAGRRPRRRARSRRGSPSRSSPRGSSSVTTTSRPRSPAIRPISGRLAVSRSPADPKTAISPPPREAASGREQVEHGLERGRAVGVVDDDPERLAELDPLHPAGHAVDRREAVADGRRVEPDRLAEGDDRQRVVDVEPAGEPELERSRRPTGRRRRCGGRGVLLDAGRPDVGGRVRAVGQDPGAGLLGDADERAGRRVVGVDDAGRRPAERLAGLAHGSRAPASRSNSDSFASR